MSQYIVFGEDITISEEDVDKVVAEVLKTLKKELPAEALTVDVLDYIVNRLQEKARRMQIKC